MCFLGLGDSVGGFIHLIVHACFKALLFIGAGLLIYHTHEQDLRRLRGAWVLFPKEVFIITVSSLSLSGLPCFSGFFSKHIVLLGNVSNIMVVGCFLSFLLTLCYSLRLVSCLFGECSWKMVSQTKTFYSLLPLLLLGVVVGGVISSNVQVDFFNLVPQVDIVFLVFWGICLIAILKGYMFSVF